MKKLKKTLLVLILFLISISAIAGPTKPGLIKVSQVTHNSVTIEWKKSTGADFISYEVNWRIRKEGKPPTDWAFIDGCCLTQKTSVAMNSLSPSTKYEVRIIAWSRNGVNSAEWVWSAFTTLRKPVLYQRTGSIPTGFSMVSIPFKYMSQTVPDIFGYAENVSELTIYKFADSGFTINSYDKDFGEWDDPKMILEAGQAVWILNSGNGPVFWMPLGYIPNNWRILSD